MPLKRRTKKTSPVAQHKSSNFKQLIWLLGILIGLLLFAKITTLLLALNQPMGFRPSGENFAWDQKSTVNLVFVSPKSDSESATHPPTFGSETDQSLVSFDPKTEKITILDISPLSYAELPQGRGFWKIGSVYKLGQDENPPRGGQLLEQSLGKLLGLPIDGVIVLKQPAKIEDLMTKLHTNRLEILALMRSISSDLTPLQAGSLIWKLAEVRTDKLVTLNFLESNITESKLLPDSSRVLGVNTIKLDLFIRDNLADSNISQENKNIAIFNGTSHPGLTTEVSRILTNMGGNVIITGSAQTQLEKTQVVFAREEKSLTASRLTQIFAPDCLPNGCRSLDPKVAESRAQINIVLGEDYYQMWYQR